MGGPITRGLREEKRWLWVVGGGRDWLLPGSRVQRLIRAPRLQPIPAQTALAGLAVHHGGVYPAARLSEVLGIVSTEPPEPALWGVLADAGLGPVLLLVDDHFGMVKIRPGEVEWVEDPDGENSCFLGTIDRKDQRLTLVDPLRLKDLIPQPVSETELRMYNLGRTGSSGEESPDEGPKRALLLVEDGGRDYALPAPAVFNVARAAEPAADLFFLADAASGGLDGGVRSRRTSAFVCELRNGDGVMKIAFDRPVRWIEIPERDIRAWPGMEGFRFSGAFRLPEEDRTIMAVDAGRLMDGYPDRVFRIAAMPDPGPVGGTGDMKAERDDRLVKIRAGEGLAALPLTNLHLVFSLRRAKIHRVSSTQPLVAGLMERDGEFLSIVDLGRLFSGKPTEFRPENRLLEVRTGEGMMALLVDEVFEPAPVSPEARVAWDPADDGPSLAAYVEGAWREDPEAPPIPVLDPDRLAASLKDQGAHDR